MEEIKVLIVDDHHIVRHGLKLLFLSDPLIEVVGEAESAQDAIDFLNGKNEVDVVVTDITMSEIDGIELTRIITKNYPSKVLVLSMHLDEKYIKEAMAAGAKGYLVKDTTETDIIQAIKRVNEGEIFLTSKVSDILAKALLKSSENAAVQQELSLTKREKEILKYIVEGLSNREVGVKLHISERTVTAHRYNMMKKLKANNTADLVRISLKYDLVS
ncbi:MAG: response regulator transcription factor [Crocinitomicaceae bacterium]|nr:response regulator transcription factor [Crocinitomicaceae bacterium]